MKKKLVGLFLALAVCFSLSIPALAVEDCDSSIVRVNFEGTSYEVWSTLYKDGSMYRGATWIKTADNSNILAGGVQVQAFLFDSKGEVDSSSLSTLSSPCYFHVAYTDYRATSDTGVYATGTAYVKDSQGSYHPFSSSNTRQQNLSRAAAIQGGMLASNGSYFTNSAGETYGSLALASMVGTEPDLILASGTEGQSGYVRCEDLFANYDTEGAGGQYIALYDLNGNVIGNFLIVFNDSSKIIGKDIETVHAELANGRAEDPDLWAAADKGLVNGEYPVNANGETYGHAILKSLVGYEPDLIQAVNRDGLIGYVRNSDTPVVTVDAETGDDMYQVPLYDKDGQVIGSFDFGGGGQIEIAGKSVADVRHALK